MSERFMLQKSDPWFYHKLDVNKQIITALSLVLALLLGACDQGIDRSVIAQYKELSWTDLKPEPEFDFGEGSELGQDSELKSLEFVDDWYSDQYAQGPGSGLGYAGPPPQSYSVEIVPELDGSKIRVPGFIVPVEFESGNRVTEFFLVPYFGACIHKPPPPPNQTIYVVSDEAIEFESIYDPVWVMGVINTKQVGNSIATAAYSMDYHLLEAFTEW